MNKEFKQQIKAIIFGVFVALFANVVSALVYLNSSSSPTSDNVPAPINQSSVSQSKAKSFPTNGSLLDIGGVISSNGLGINGDALIGNNLTMSKLSASGVSERELCVDSNGVIKSC